MSVRALELSERLGALNPAKSGNETLRRRIFWERIILLPLLAAAALGFMAFGLVQVNGISMEPQFRTGDRLFYLKAYQWFAPLQPGDIVVINKKYGKYAGIHLIKRVFFIQNEEGNATWPKTIQTASGAVVPLDMFPNYQYRGAVVPKHHILVVGDNFENSEDSRDDSIGPIAEDEIMGKAFIR